MVEKKQIEVLATFMRGSPKIATSGDAEVTLTFWVGGAEINNAMDLMDVVMNNPAKQVKVTLDID